METMKSLISAVSPHLKDMYFHVAVAPCHRKFLWFHWHGQSYEFQVPAFGLSSAPLYKGTGSSYSSSTKTRHTGLRLPRRHPPHNEQLPSSAGGSPTGPTVYLTQAGFALNIKKSDLTLTQDLVYIRGRFHTDLGQVFLPENRALALISCVQSFCKVGAYRSAPQFLSMLGLMASTLQVMTYTHLHMHPVQRYVKDHWNLCDLSKKRLKLPILIRPDLVDVLQWWTVPAM